MGYDRAGYLNNCATNGAYNRYNNNCSSNRFNDNKLIKKELHYVESYERNRNSASDCYNNVGECGNYDRGCNNSGYYDNTNCGPPCGPINGGCFDRD